MEEKKKPIDVEVEEVETAERTENTTSEQKEDTSKKKGFWSKLSDGFKKFCDDTNNYIDSCQKKSELGKLFDKEATSFCDLSNGKTVNGITDGIKVLLRKETTFDPLHRFYANGKIYMLNDNEKDTVVQYEKDGNPESLECYCAPCEIYVAEISDREAAIDEFERLVKAYEPNFLELYKADKEAVVADFVAFRKALAGTVNPELYDEIVTHTVKFAPKAALIAAELVSTQK